MLSQHDRILALQFEHEPWAIAEGDYERAEWAYNLLHLIEPWRACAIAYYVRLADEEADKYHNVEVKYDVF